MRIKKGYILRNIAGVHMIVPVGERVIDFKGMMSLNDTGAFLWNIMQTDTTNESLLQALCEQYEVDEKSAQKDIEDFVNAVNHAGALLP